jgi:hypothetical protein
MFIRSSQASGSGGVIGLSAPPGDHPADLHGFLSEKSPLVVLTEVWPFYWDTAAIAAACTNYHSADDRLPRS